MARPVKWRVSFGREFLLSTDLSPTEKAIIMALAAHADMHLRSYPTKVQICDAAGISPRGLWRYLAKLKGKYVEFEETRIKGRLRILYTLLPPCQIGMESRLKSSVPNLRDGDTQISVPNWHGGENLTISTRAPAPINPRSTPTKAGPPHAPAHEEADASHAGRNGSIP